MPSRVIRLKAIALMDRGINALEQAPVQAQGLDRRAFFKTSASTLALAWLAACDSSGPDSAEKTLAYATRKNESIEMWLLQHTRMNHGSPGAATAGDRFPSYFVSDTVPRFDATSAEWALDVGGMVNQPLRLQLKDLMAMPRVEQRVDHFCVEGWTAAATFVGVSMREIMKSAGAQPGATAVDFQSFDDGYHESWDIESVMHPQTMIVYAKDGKPLSPAWGAPARVHSPIKLGYKNTKYLTKIVFMSERNGGYWSDRGYEWFGGT